MNRTLLSACVIAGLGALATACTEELTIVDDFGDTSDDTDAAESDGGEDAGDDAAADGTGSGDDTSTDTSTDTGEDTGDDTGEDTGDDTSTDTGEDTVTEPACGDGEVNGEEICDPSARISGCSPGDLCNSVCSACEEPVVPACGDGELNGTEVCDPTASVNSGCEAPNVCNDACTECITQGTEPACGDGAVNGTEVCDPSSVLAPGCEAPERCLTDCSACEIPPRCGDNAVNGDETCDASAPESGCDADSRCLADCSECELIPATCGNATVERGEVCDGDAGCEAGQTCNDDCTVCAAPACGNGTVERTEVCDFSAEVNGCGDTEICTVDCTACSTCGNYTIEGTEACDNDGIFGETGTCAEGEACRDCGCVPLGLEIVEAEASATAIVGTFSAAVTVHDEAEFTNFALLLGDADGNLVDYFQGGRDLLLESRRVPEDNPTDYVWNLQVHFAVPPDSTELAGGFVYLVLYGADGVASNAVTWDADVLFTAPDTGADCDPDAYLPVCIPNHLCEGTPAVCTDIGDVFDLSAFRATATGRDAIRFDFELIDDLGDYLPYWSLYFATVDGTYVAFRAYDAEPIDNGDGTWSASYTIDNVTENLGVPLSDITDILAVVYDRGDVAESDVVSLP